MRISLPRDTLFLFLSSRSALFYQISLQARTSRRSIQAFTPQPPRPDKINPARINVQTIATLALECRWEFPEDFSLNELRTSFRDQISLLTSKATPPPKAYKRPLHKPYYTRRVKRAIQRRRQAWKNSENSSCGTAYLRLQQEQRRSRRILEPNASLMNGNWQTQPSWLLKNFSLM